MTNTAVPLTTAEARLAHEIARGCLEAARTVIPAAQQGTDAWYAASYLPIIQLFKATSRVDDHDQKAFEAAWAQRKAMVGSWLQGISKCGINIEAARELRLIEHKFVSTNLSDLTLPAVESALKDGDPDFPLQTMLKEANRLLNKNPEVRVVSCSKLLHFMMPGLVPIFDTNVSKRLFGDPTPTVDEYLEYVRLLRAYLQTGPYRQSLVEQAALTGVTPVRYADRFLFRKRRSEK